MDLHVQAMTGVGVVEVPVDADAVAERLRHVVEVLKQRGVDEAASSWTRA